MEICVYTSNIIVTVPIQCCNYYIHIYTYEVHMYLCNNSAESLTLYNVYNVIMMYRELTKQSEKMFDTINLRHGSVRMSL